MKKNKQVLGALFIAAAMSISGSAMSQVAVGLRAGVNFSNVGWKDGQGKKIDTKLNPGFHAGVTFDIPVADEFYVQPGALFSTKGFKRSIIETANVNYESKETPSYLEVPINFLFKPELGSGKLLLGAGPYVAYGLGGKYKNSGDFGNLNVSQDGSLEFKNDYKDASNDKSVYGKPFDYGANLLAGYEFNNKVSFQLNAQLGMANTVPNNNGVKPSDKVKNVGFGLSLGYKF